MYQHVKFNRRTPLNNNNTTPNKDIIEFVVMCALWCVWVIIIFCY